MAVPRSVVIFATHQLAKVDYSCATRVSDNVAHIVQWSYDHDQWWIAQSATHFLQQMDDLGSLLIAFVIWLTANSR